MKWPKRAATATPANQITAAMINGATTWPMPACKAARALQAVDDSRVVKVRHGGILSRGIGYGRLHIQAARRSGNSAASPSPVAAQTPRSVISPVTSSAGVTSKAGLAAGLPGAVII